MINLKDYIRTVPDFPREGIGFKDITPLILDKDAFNAAIGEMCKRIDTEKVDKILGIESRGFIFAGALADRLNKGLIIARKPGKLPYKTLKKEYLLEYGADSVEIHIDSIEKGERILIVDDLLATGGTVQATASLVEQAGGIVEAILFLIELNFINGREKLTKYKIHSLIHFDKD